MYVQQTPLERDECDRLALHSVENVTAAAAQYARALLGSNTTTGSTARFSLDKEVRAYNVLLLLQDSLCI
jgi:hypothetical protein